MASSTPSISASWRRSSSVRFGPDEYPYLREHAEQHFAGFGSEGKGAYELVLDLILDGIERDSRAA